MELKKNFEAAMFDFDGTITAKGAYQPSKQMAELLVNLAHKMPIAFCTGRQLESFVKRGLNVLLAEIDKTLQPGFLENLHLVAENGSVGYYFDTDKHEFEEFYQVKWPDSFIKKPLLIALLEKAIKDYGSIYYDAHKVVIVMRTNLHDTENRDIADVYALSDKIFDIVAELLEKIDPEYEKFLHIGNSGIGVIICPADGDKDRGIKEFADFLGKNRGMQNGDIQNRGMQISEDAKEIVVVGDSAQKGGNDYYFLNGELGFAYNVGEHTPTGQWPKPVVNAEGLRLFNDIATMYLIKSFL